MAISLVTGEWDGDSNAGGDFEIIFSNVVPVSGNMLVLFLATSEDDETFTPQTGRDLSGTPSWTADWSGPIDSRATGDEVGALIWYRQITDADEEAVRVVGSVGNMLAVVAHFEGQATSSVLDTSNTDNVDAVDGANTSNSGSATASAAGAAIALHAFKDSRFVDGSNETTLASGWDDIFSGIILPTVYGGATNYPALHVAFKTYSSGTYESTATIGASGIEENAGAIGLFKEAATGGATVTLTPDSLAITEGTLSVEVSTDVSLNADSLAITEPGVTVDVATDVAVTLSPDTLAITEPGVGVSYNVDITPIADSLVLSEPGVSIAYDVSVTPSADALTITEPGLDVTASIEVNTNADSLVLTEGSLSIDVGNDVTVSLSPDSLVLTAGPLTVQADVDTLVTLVNDVLTITEPGLTVQADVDVAVTLNADTLTITDGSLGVAIDVIATLVPDSLVITEPGINVTIGGDVDVTLSADTLTLSEGTLTITASSLVTLEMVYNKLLEIEALLANHAGPIGATEEVILTTDYAQVGLYFDGSQYQVF